MAREFPGKTGEAILDALFAGLSTAKLSALLRRDRGPFRGMEGKLAVHVVPANVPNPSVTSVVLGLLADADNAVKLSRRDPGLFGVWLESLAAHDPSLASRVTLFSSPAGLVSRLREASLVIAYGSDETVAELKKLSPKGARFVGYGDRVSAAVFSRTSLTDACARAAAYDAWMMDRRGCMSPDAFFVEAGGPVEPEVFAAAVADELEKLRAGRISFSRALRLKGARDREKLRAVKGESVSPRVPVRVFRSEKELVRLLRRYGKKFQTAAVEGPPEFRRRVEGALRRLGASRVCRAGEMQRPPLSWDHEKPKK